MLDFEGLVEEIKSTNFPMVKLHDVCEILTGGEPPEDNIREKVPLGEYKYPIYSNGTGDKSIWGYAKTYRVDRECVTFSSIGTIGNPQYRNYPFIPVIRLKVLYPKDDQILNTKFLKYALELVKLDVQTSTVPNINAQLLGDTEIPLPSLEVQNKIVHFLDVFTALITALITALRTEENKRKEQYSEYRDLILNTDNQLFKSLFSSNLKIEALKNLVQIKIGTQLNRDKLYSSGLYPVMNRGCVPSGYYDQYNVDKDIISIAQGGNPGYVQYNYTPFWAGAHCYYLIPTSDLVLNKYLYFYLKNKENYFFKSKRGKAGTSVPSLHRSVLQELEIPIPSLSDQRKIIEILESLEHLSSDISSGLPAEIQAREKQYQYYLETLLNPFK